MIGGGKAGNVMSPNPNAIAASDAFNVPLTSVMAAGVIPGLCGMVFAYFIAKKLVNKGSKVQEHEVVAVDHSRLPKFGAAIIAPLVAIALLACALSQSQCRPTYRPPTGWLNRCRCHGALP